MSSYAMLRIYESTSDSEHFQENLVCKEDLDKDAGLKETTTRIILLWVRILKAVKNNTSFTFLIFTASCSIYASKYIWTFGYLPSHQNPFLISRRKTQKKLDKLLLWLQEEAFTIDLSSFALHNNSSEIMLHGGIGYIYSSPIT